MYLLGIRTETWPKIQHFTFRQHSSISSNKPRSRSRTQQNWICDRRNIYSLEIQQWSSFRLRFTVGFYVDTEHSGFSRWLFSNGKTSPPSIYLFIYFLRTKSRTWCLIDVCFWSWPVSLQTWRERIKRGHWGKCYIYYIVFIFIIL